MTEDNKLVHVQSQRRTVRSPGPPVDHAAAFVTSLGNADIKDVAVELRRLADLIETDTVSGKLVEEGVMVDGRPVLLVHLEIVPNR